MCRHRGETTQYRTPSFTFGQRHNRSEIVVSPHGTPERSSWLNSTSRYQDYRSSEPPSTDQAAVRRILIWVNSAQLTAWRNGSRGYDRFGFQGQQRARVAEGWHEHNSVGRWVRSLAPPAEEH
jgi:hypothetical protein